jgi:hypothetical protein
LITSAATDTPAVSSAISKSGLSTGAKAGIAICVVLGVLSLFLAIFVFRRGSCFGRSAAAKPEVEMKDGSPNVTEFSSRRLTRVKPPKVPIMYEMEDGGGYSYQPNNRHSAFVV